MENIDRDYCYARISEDGYADVIHCSNMEFEVLPPRYVEIPEDEESRDWHRHRYYDFETGEWGEKHEFPEPEPELNPWEEEVNQLKLAMAEMAEAHEQEKTEMQLALAELAELVGGEANHG